MSSKEVEKGRKIRDVFGHSEIHLSKGTMYECLQKELKMTFVYTFALTFVFFLSRSCYDVLTRST